MNFWKDAPAFLRNALRDRPASSCRAWNRLLISGDGNQIVSASPFLSRLCEAIPETACRECGGAQNTRLMLSIYKDLARLSEESLVSVTCSVVFSRAHSASIRNQYQVLNISTYITDLTTSGLIIYPA